MILLWRYEKIAERLWFEGPVTVNTMKISIYAEKKRRYDEKGPCTCIGDDLPVADYTGATSTMEDLYTLCFNTYESFIHWTNDMILTEHETRVELPEEDIETINQILNL